MNLLDLFSGIGGFSLGLERAGFKTVAFCEIEDYPRRVLAHHWPGVPIYHDVRELDAARLRADGIDRIDAICGGFPCQDVSVAGKGAGLDGERSGLWREFARLIGELRPEVAIVENVGALRGRGLATVLGDLAAIGYDAEWHVVPAAAVGAPHLRERVWIVAADADAQRRGQAEEKSGVDCSGRWGEVDGCADANPDSRRLKRQRVAQHADKQGAPGREPDGLGARGWRDGPAAADAERIGRTELRGLQRRLARALTAAQTPWPRTVEPPLCGLDDGLPRELVRQHRAALKALGNAVVPAIPEILGRAYLEGRSR